LVTLNAISHERNQVNFIYFKIKLSYFLGGLGYIVLLIFVEQALIFI